jgi:hypothetical protein
MVCLDISANIVGYDIYVQYDISDTVSCRVFPALLENINEDNREISIMWRESAWRREIQTPLLGVTLAESVIHGYLQRFAGLIETADDGASRCRTKM